MIYETEKFGDANFYHVYTVENLSWFLHFHRCYECICLNEGGVSVTVDDGVFDLTPGDTLFICPNQLHAIRTADFSRVTILQFSPEMVGHFSTAYQGKIPLRPLLRSFSIQKSEYDAENIYLQKSLLYRICGCLCGQTDFAAYDTSPLCEEVVFRVFRYIEQHFTGDCSLGKIARTLGYDYAYLSRAFKNKTGISFKAYLNQFRINQACISLSNSDAAISEIAFQCGFDSIRSFNRNFTAVTGTSPAGYRQSVSGPSA